MRSTAIHPSHKTCFRMLPSSPLGSLIVMMLSISSPTSSGSAHARRSQNILSQQGQNCGLDTVARGNVVFTLPQIEFPPRYHSPWLQNTETAILNFRIREIQNQQLKLGRSDDPRDRQEQRGDGQVGPEHQKKLLFAPLFTPLTAATWLPEAYSVPTGLTSDNTEYAKRN